MRKLILQEWISLDGYVADKNGELDFFERLTPEKNTYSDTDQLQFLDSIDTIVLGRKTYELFVSFWPDATNDQEVIADQLNGKQKRVVSNTLSKAPWGRWPEAEIISGDVVTAIRALKTQPGKDIVLWGSIGLAQSLMQERLIDEYHLRLCPVITAGGRSLFTSALQPHMLHLNEIRHYPTGSVFLNYGATKS